MTDTHDQLISRLATVLASLHSVEPATSRFCEAGRQMLDADGAALALHTAKDALILLAATNDLAGRLEDLQEVVGEGPTKDAFRTNAVQITDLATHGERQWPLMYEHGRGLGFPSIMIAVPLTTGGQVIGTFTAHRDSGQNGSDVVTSEFLSVALGAAILHDPDLGLPNEVYSEEWPSTAQIHQATGMVISQAGVRPEDALALLRGHAFATNSTLLEVARQIIDRRIDFRNLTIEGD